MPIGSGRIARAVSCHAWSPDKKHIALSPNNSDVLIYEAGAGDAAAWKLVHTLSEVFILFFILLMIISAVI
jgi:hypothetical protein